MNKKWLLKIDEERLKRSFKISDQIFFAQRLSLLLNSGISIVEALSMISNMDKSKYRKRVYLELISSIEQGISLSKSIKNTPVKFNSLFLNLIQNGESSGRLTEALSLAFSHLEKKNEMRNKLLSSLLYPAFIVVATLAMTLFLILYIFPKIIPLLKSLDIKLPLITRVVQGVYYFCVSYGIWFALGVFLIAILLHLLIKKVEKIKSRFHLFLISIPIINNYIKIYLMASVCSMGEMLLSSGKGLPEMIKFSEEAVRNIVYKNIFSKIYSESLQGINFSTSLKKYNNRFPVLLADMCELGERTGNLALMLGYCAKIFEQDIDNSLKKFSSLIEPVLMVFMGLLVGSIALSIILPVYEITNHLTK